MKGRLCMMLAIVATGCAIQKPRTDIQSVSDSRVVEKTRIVTHCEFVPVQVAFEVPEVHELRRNVKDSTDIIENDFAVSTVTVHADGTFDHGLETKHQALMKTVDVPVQSTDSCFFRETSDKASEREVEVRTVETNVLKWWQKILAWTGAATLILMAGYAVILIFRYKVKAVPTLFEQLLKRK